MKNIQTLIPIIFLVIGITNSYLADIICYFWLDDLECYIQIACKAWDTVEYWIAHKLLAMLFYWLGWYGFSGGILFLIEQHLLSGWINRNLGLEKLHNALGFIISAILCMIIINWLSSYLYLDVIFENLYNLINRQ